VFVLKLLAADPYVNAVELGYIGAHKVPLDTLLANPISWWRSRSSTRDATPDRRTRARLDEAHRLLHQRVARSVVDERALIDTLRGGRIAGAALDVFEQEPVDPANPLLAMDNVIVTPHALCWTDECFHTWRPRD